MKLFFGLAVATGLVVPAGCANAQTAPSDGGRARFQATSDFQDPDVQGPYGPPPVPPAAVPRPYGYGPPPDDDGYGPRYGHGPRYGDGPQYGYGPDLMPVGEVYAVLRENGFSPLGIPRQRGFVYVIAAVDRAGQDGRLVIDGRSGRIIRFMPAYRWGLGYERMHYEPDLHQPGPPPPFGARAALPAPTVIGGTPQPPATVPPLASRSVPIPPPKPLTASKPAQIPQQSAAVVTKPAEPPPAQPQAAMSPLPSTTVGQSKPAPQILPTQEMPKVQGLE
jgi:hypothetical protein